MVVLAIALITIWQTSTLLEAESYDSAMVAVPHQLTAGNQSFDLIEQVPTSTLKDIKDKSLVRQQYDYSCGSAALTTVLNYYLGMDLTESKVMNGLLTYGEKEKIIERKGFSLADMKRFVTALGYKSGGFRGKIKNLRELNQPAIIPIHYGDFKHFVVLRDIIGSRVYIADPAFGNLTLLLSEFEQLWDNNVLFLIYAEEGQAIDALHIAEHDLAFINEQEVKNIELYAEQPHTFHKLDRDASFASQRKLYYKN